MIRAGKVALLKLHCIALQLHCVMIVKHAAQRCLEQRSPVFLERHDELLGKYCHSLLL